YCTSCRKHFTVSTDDLAMPRSPFTNKVRRRAVDLIFRNKGIYISLERASEIMKEKHHVIVAPTTIHDWVVAELYPGL
ncbi:MAG: hypothetical protein ACTSWQ_04260, partial [Candidatus Thorarchaeota archaeon]